MGEKPCSPAAPGIPDRCDYCPDDRQEIKRSDGEWYCGAVAATYDPEDFQCRLGMATSLWLTEVNTFTGQRFACEYVCKCDNGTPGGEACLGSPIGNGYDRDEDNKIPDERV